MKYRAVHVRDVPWAVVRVLKDPFFYAMSLPSVWLLFAAVFSVLLVLAAILSGVWLLLRRIIDGAHPDISAQPIKMFIAMGCTAVFILAAGMLGRRLTRPQVRGKFVQFSKTVKYRDGCLCVSVIDMRRTQLIGISVSVELIAGDPIKAVRVPAESPSIIVIPTEICVPVSSLFPSLAQATTCDICGCWRFSNFKTYAQHMSFHHGVTKAESKDEFMQRLREEVNAVDTFRVVVSGTDEVSGKGGFATKEYKRSEIVLDANCKESETFSVISDVPHVTTDKDASDTEEASTTLSEKSNYVHVAFFR